MPPLVFDSENLPPRPATHLFYGTFDSEELRPPTPPPGPLFAENQEAEGIGLRAPTVEGPLVPPTTPAPPPDFPTIFSRTGGPDGDMSVVHESPLALLDPTRPGLGFAPFVIEMAPNPPEVPRLPPAPAGGPADGSYHRGGA